MVGFRSHTLGFGILGRRGCRVVEAIDSALLTKGRRREGVGASLRGQYQQGLRPPAKAPGRGPTFPTRWIYVKHANYVETST